MIDPKLDTVQYLLSIYTTVGLDQLQCNFVVITVCGANILGNAAICPAADESWLTDRRHIVKLNSQIRGRTKKLAELVMPAITTVR